VTTKGRFGRLPVRHKLVAMIMATSASALLLSSIGYLVSNYYQTKSDLESELVAQATLVVENSAVALRFRDADVASATLHTLAANNHVRTACLYLADGSILAEFRPRIDSLPCPGEPGPPEFRYTTNRVHYVRAAEHQGEHVGTLYLRSDIERLTTNLQIQGAIVLALLLATLGVALFLSARLQTIVSEPVVSLASTAQAVSSRGDYSLRAKRTTDDELGVLVDAFNRMLERIQLRESELSRTNEDLRREIAERRRAEQERAELLVREREANRLKDEFLATLSHELRTPLNAILGWTKLLRANAVPAASIDRALEKVERNAQVQTRLVEDLLEVSRITSGKLRLELRPIDLIALANTAIDSIRPMAEARGVAVGRRMGPFAMPTIGDPDRLQQVIWNLISNAVKFTPSGGVVTVQLTRNEGTDEIVVSDTGIGIEPAFLPNVFDTFRQADASSTRTQGGLGLGLSIVRHLAEMHGGDVRAESDGLGKGARFIVRLPVRAIDREPPPDRDATSPPPSSILTERRLDGISVLVVDDDQDTRELLVSVLQAVGASVHPAASAAEAFETGTEVIPDVIVSDVAMPGQDGYSLMRELDLALGDRAPRVRVALTAFAGERDREQALEAGYQRHIPKPFDPATLIGIVEELLARGGAPQSR
jgi:signal transduction histidine kinase/ActR/RegA family two-component response regulator